MKERVAVAMSGGVDSSVSAALLKEEGYEVIGLTARMCPEGFRGTSGEFVQEARRVADFLDIPHFVVDLQVPFRERIISYFVAEYARGRTPSPCAVCNRTIKFGALMDHAVTLGARRMATGHYARLCRDEDGTVHLLTGLDPDKDQSYFLFDLSQKQLRHAMFPLGLLTKKEVKEAARKRSMPVTTRGESQDLCFVAEGDHYDLTEELRPEVKVSGDIVDANGRKLGRHAGIHRFTIGQRRGLGIATGKPLYVVGLDAANNQVIVGPKQALEKKTASLKGVRWTLGKRPAGPFTAFTKIRYNHEGAASRVVPLGPHAAAVEFEKPQFAITPGQIAAFYAGEELIGGGWIEK